MDRVILEACLPWIAVLLASCAVLVLLARMSGARLNWGRLRSLHRCQEGNVQSLSFVVTMPVFIMVVMFIVQVSQILVGMVTVHYAAYAAARAAVVWLPANVPESEEWANAVTLLDRGADLRDYRVEPVGKKYEMIRRAAVLACAPICPSRDIILNGPSPPQQVTEMTKAAYAAIAPGSRGGSRIGARIENKIAYSYANTDVLITGLDMDDHFSGPTYNPWLYELGRLKNPNEIGWQDPITVTVRHRFALLPGPGRLLATVTPTRDGRFDRLAEEIRLNDGAEYREKRSGKRRAKERVYVYPIFASATLTSEGIKSVRPHAQNPY